MALAIFNCEHQSGAYTTNRERAQYLNALPDSQRAAGLSEPISSPFLFLLAACSDDMRLGLHGIFAAQSIGMGKVGSDTETRMMERRDLRPCW